MLAQSHPEPVYMKRSNAVSAAPPEVLFGSFRSLPTRFLLLEGDEPVPLGSRARDILTVLLEHPGKLVSKQELMARVWPDTFVEPANLTVHISALRRMLRDGKYGNRFIVNITGRGYSFVAPVEYRGGRIESEPAWNGTRSSRFIEDAANSQLSIAGGTTPAWSGTP